MTRLVIARHGQAICNVERTIEGVATCRGLTELGRRQARALGERLLGEAFHADMVVTSPIARALETAVIVCEVLGTALGPSYPEFEEVRPGESEGMTWDQYRAFYGNDEGWDPMVPFAPGAEAWADFARRVSSGIDRLTSDHAGQAVLLVAHGGVVDLSLFHYFGLDPTVRSPIDFETCNASITEWELRAHPFSKPEDPHRWRLVRYNDAAHVADMS